MEFALMTAPTLDMARPGDVIGLNLHFTPARRIEDVRSWHPITDAEPLPGDRFRVTVAGGAGGEFPMTMRSTVPVVLKRHAYA
jgi:hypothetical protein